MFVPLLVDLAIGDLDIKYLQVIHVTSELDGVHLSTL